MSSKYRLRDKWCSYSLYVITQNFQWRLFYSLSTQNRNLQKKIPNVRFSEGSQILDWKTRSSIFFSRRISKHLSTTQNQISTLYKKVWYPYGFWGAVKRPICISSASEMHPHKRWRKSQNKLEVQVYQIKLCQIWIDMNFELNC